MNYWHNFEDLSKKRKNNNQTHRGRPPGVAEDGGALSCLPPPVQDTRLFARLALTIFKNHSFERSCTVDAFGGFWKLLQTLFLEKTSKTVCSENVCEKREKDVLLKQLRYKS